MSELNIGGSNVTVELRGEDLYAKANTGNKHWVAVLTGTHPKYNYEREFVMYQKPRTSNRDDGTVAVEDGAVIERVRYTHSGKNRSDAFYQLVGGEAHRIDEADVEAALDGDIVADVTPTPRDIGDDLTPAVVERHVCDVCGAEFDSAHGLATHTGMVHAADTDSPEVATDGGEEIRERREVEGTDAHVRTYSADGTLYAYRDGDEHVVVSRGRDRGDKWTTRVPATREAVVEGEQLWTIPDNWEYIVGVTGEMINHAYYRIPASEVAVKVSVSKKDHLVDCWYRVNAVGEFEIRYADDNDDAFDQAALANIAEWEERYDSFPHKVSADAQTILERLADPDRYAFKRLRRAYRASVNEFAPEHVREMWAGRASPSVPDSVYDPWDVQWELPPVIVEAFDTSHEVAREVAGVLSEYSAIPSYPKVRIGIGTVSLGDSYYVRALTEAGCTPSQAVDYLMCEIAGETQTEWAEARGKNQSTVSGNVSAAKRQLET